MFKARPLIMSPGGWGRHNGNIVYLLIKANQDQLIFLLKTTLMKRSTWFQVSFPWSKVTKNAFQSNTLISSTRDCRWTYCISQGIGAKVSNIWLCKCKLNQVVAHLPIHGYTLRINVAGPSSQSQLARETAVPFFCGNGTLFLETPAPNHLLLAKAGQDWLPTIIGMAGSDTVWYKEATSSADGLAKADSNSNSS